MKTLFYLLTLALLCGCAHTGAPQSALPTLPSALPDSPPMPPKLPGVIYSAGYTYHATKSVAVPASFGGEPVIAPPPPIVCTNCPYMFGETNTVSDLGNRPEITFQIAGLQDYHSYIVEASTDLTHWQFIDGFSWLGLASGLFADGDWTINWPMDIARQTFFRVVDQGSNQPPLLEFLNQAPLK